MPFQIWDAFFIMKQFAIIVGRMVMIGMYHECQNYKECEELKFLEDIRDVGKIICSSWNFFLKLYRIVK